ncbi:ATP-binding protein [Labedaea rhizosphaerae]|uniref:Signal transduction histidine-protein kinase/phosphatase MprB n=1 Tax=Labedaea rhizosphaerae TaxID=598644 RepID=A0A4R6S6P4_LABRH|nr:ATP-binding protein [Labedaea rhizosphaerae]TDP95023.1 two-component system sensor histidine kinase MtrB [Labedaea rhizosphaerae]
MIGLRTRLLLAFALLSAVTAAAVAGVGYARSRDAIVQRTQDNAVIETTNRIEQLYPLPADPDQDALEKIAGGVSGREGNALVEANGLRAGGLDPSIVTAALREEVDSGRIAWQRVAAGNHTMLVIGSQLRITDDSGVTEPSGITVYVVRGLLPEEEVVHGLARDAWLIGGAGVVMTMVLALLAARSVLRPVRELQRTAQRLGSGDLNARLHVVRGRDELAAVAHTFNQTAESLQHHVGELRRMESDARRFVADVSHELRTPLAAMSAVTDMLDAEAAELPPVAGEAVRLVSRETHNLTRLVNDLIEVTRFDSGTAALALDEIDVADAIRVTLRVRGFGDRVETDLPDGIRAVVDPRRLDVIVANLVGNALRHGAPPVTVTLRTEGDDLVLTVTDAGPGLDPEVLPHVFDRFYKADTARSRSEGSGLGLAIAWENARLHGGALIAGNGAGGGAVFTLRMPRHQPGQVVGVPR